MIIGAKAVRYLKPSQSEFQKLFSTLCGSRSDWQVWSDFITMSATAISNACGREGPAHDERERQYMELARAYTKDEINTLAQLLSTVVMALEDDPRQDFLGEVFQGLGLNSQLKRGIPSSGALYVAQDIDRTAALMCYIQLSLLGCAGYVIIGDSLLHPPTGHALCLGPAPELDVWYLPMLYEQTWHYRRMWHGLDMIFRSERIPAVKKKIPQLTAAIPVQPLPTQAFSETAAGESPEKIV